MADTMYQLADGSCPLVATDVYTSTGNVSVVAIDIANPTAAVETVTAKLHDKVLFSISLPAYGGVSWHGPQLITNGQKINLVSSSASCEYHITGVRIT